MSEKVCAHVIVSGRVQGVFYRLETQRAAEEFGVSGWVKNLPDGRVEAMMTGDKAAVESLIGWCRQGPRAARVDRVEVSWEEEIGRFSGFDVVY